PRDLARPAPLPLEEIRNAQRRRRGLRFLSLSALGSRLALLPAGETTAVRILVLDASAILPWRIRHALTEAHEVIAARGLEEAEGIARAGRPDAAVVSVPHSS